MVPNKNYPVKPQLSRVIMQTFVQCGFNWTLQDQLKRSILYFQKKKKINFDMFVIYVGNTKTTKIPKLDIWPKKCFSNHLNVYFQQFIGIFSDSNNIFL